jgi:hypothetical protein
MGSNRMRGRVRILALAALVGVVAGIGGIGFYIATRVVEHYAMGVVAGYSPEPHPGGEPTLAWIPAVTRDFNSWLLLLMSPRWV